MGSTTEDLLCSSLVIYPKRDPADTYRIDPEVVDIVRPKVGVFRGGECTIYMPRVEEPCYIEETRLIGWLVGEVL